MRRVRFDDPTPEEEIGSVHSRVSVLSVADAPDGHGDLILDLVISEFSCLNSGTKEPDYATLRIRYVPEEWVLQQPSLSLYFTRFRQYETLPETVVQTVADDLIEVLQPFWLQIVGEFRAYGSVLCWPTVTYQRKS